MAKELRHLETIAHDERVGIPAGWTVLADELRRHKCTALEHHDLESLCRTLADLRNEVDLYLFPASPDVVEATVRIYNNT